MSDMLVGFDFKFLKREQIRSQLYVNQSLRSCWSSVKSPLVMNFDTRGLLFREQFKRGCGGVFCYQQPKGLSDTLGLAPEFHLVKSLVDD